MTTIPSGLSIDTLPALQSPATSPSCSSGQNCNGGLSGGAVAGIAIGCVIAGLAIGLLGAWVFSKIRSRKRGSKGQGVDLLGEDKAPRVEPYDPTAYGECCVSAMQLHGTRSSQNLTPRLRNRKRAAGGRHAICSWIRTTRRHSSEHAQPGSSAIIVILVLWSHHIDEHKHGHGHGHGVRIVFASPRFLSIFGCLAPATATLAFLLPFAQ